MPILTSRAKETAQVQIDQGKCTVCGRCVEVCSGKPLFLADGRVQVDQSCLFGCIGCGQCMAVCPQGCITVEGRCLSPGDRVELAGKGERAGYQALHNLLLARRSVRHYADRAVEAEKLEQILASASTAPFGYPPSDVGVLVLNGREKVREFAFASIETAARYRWLFSPFLQFLLRPFIGKATTEVFGSFIYPALGFFAEQKAKGEDWLLYGAPAAMLFYGSPYSDPCDPYIAATYAMLAAETLGLGTCMIGSVAPFLRYNTRLKERFGIARDMRDGLVVLFGYPTVEFTHGIRRTFRQVNYL